jgi:hypothetical protein
MDGAYVTCGGEQRCIQGWGGRKPEGDHCENLGVYGKIILKIYL